MPTTELPVFGSSEKLILTIFQDFFTDHPEIHISSLFTEDTVPPMIIARRERKASGNSSFVSHDDRHIAAAIFSVNVITSGPDADEIGEELQEACRIALRQAQQDQISVPDGGSLSLITNWTNPARINDWADSTGVVQYSTLPKGWVRTESMWRLLIRPPQQTTITNRFITPGQ